MHKLSFAVIDNRTQTFLTRHYTPRKLCAQLQMSYILTYVRVALATSGLQNILDISATYDIYRTDGNHGLAGTEPNNGTADRLARKQPERPKKE